MREPLKPSEWRFDGSVEAEYVSEKEPSTKKEQQGQNPESGIRSAHLKSGKEASGWGQERQGVKTKRRGPWNGCLPQDRLGFEGHGKAVGFILSARGNDGRALSRDVILHYEGWMQKNQNGRWKMAETRWKIMVPLATAEAVEVRSAYTLDILPR